MYIYTMQYSSCLSYSAIIIIEITPISLIRRNLWITTISCLLVILLSNTILSTTAEVKHVATSQQQHPHHQSQLRPPRIKEHPTSLVVKKHDPAKLECKADGNPPPIIEWYKDNEKVEPSPSSHRLILDNSLFFLHVIAKKGEGGDTGTYYCLAKNEVGKAKSRNATLEVALLKDEFRVMPANTRVAQGKTVTLECAPPKGRPEPFVSWIHNGKPVQTDTTTGRFRLDGTNLVINDVMQHDEGQYQCIAKNMIGVRESPAAFLKVLVEPYFIRPPESIKTMADSDVVFHCQAGGDPQPKISWRKVEGEFAIGKSQILEDKALRIHQVKPSDGGTYVCEAENSAGKISRSATLIVNSLPTLVTTPKNVQALENSMAKMVCMATGNPEPIYFWFKESAHLLMFPGQTYGKYNISNDGVLFISNIAKQDQGFYICSAVSNVGSTMARAYLKVSTKDDVPPPIILLGATNQTLPLNTKAFLPCEAISPDSNKVNIEWLYNQIPIHNDTHFTITPYGLQIQNIQRTDSGVYTCIASSPSGSTRWNTRLLVESPRNPNINFSKMPHSTMFPEAPSKPMIVNVSETSTTLKWQRSGSSATSPHIGSIIEVYSPDLKSGWTEVARHITTDIFTVNNLKPNTRYLFYVRAQNIHGLGFPSEISDEIRTLDNSIQSSDEIAISRARNVLNNVNIKLRDARAISSTSIKLFWNVGNSDFIEGYYIRFQNLKDELLPTKFNMVTVFGGTTSTYTVNDLKKYAPYRFFIMPFYRNIEGKSSNIVTERTYEDVPSGPPYSITAKAINASCAIIEWLPPSEELQNGIILGYYLQIYENNTYLYTNLTLDASFNSIILYNLTLGSIFSIQILAFTAIGNGPLSSPIYLTMDLDLDSEFKVSSYNQHNFLSNLFWLYLFIVLMTIVFFIIAVRLVLIYANRKNKSIYEKANSLNENFSDNFPKYDTSNSSKYSSCPDNNEYAEVNDFKHYGENNNKAVPYAMTPLIEKSIDSKHYDNNKFFFHKMNTDNNSDLANETLLNNQAKCEMVNMNNHANMPKRQVTHNNNSKYKAYEQSGTKPSFNIFNTDFDSNNILANNYEDNNSVFESKNLFVNEIQQNSLPSGRSSFSFRNEEVPKVLSSPYRIDGRNLMTFHQNNHSPNGLPPRIISNPLSTYESSFDSSSNKNYVNHYYASSEITKIPFNDSSLSSSSTTKNSGKDLSGSCYNNCDNTNQAQLNHTDIRRNSEMNNIHNQIQKNRIYKKRKSSNTVNNNSFERNFDQ